MAGRPRKVPFADREELVLQAATAAFAARGSTAVPVGAIAEQAGVNKAHVYEHFPSKDDLVLASARRARDRLIAFIAARYEDDGSDTTARDRVRRRYHAFLDFAATEPDCIAMLALPDAAVALDGAGRDVLASGLRDTLARDLAAGGLPSDALPDILAAMFVGMAGSVLRSSVGADWDGEAVVDLLTDFTMAGMRGVERDVLERADRRRPPAPTGQDR